MSKFMVIYHAPASFLDQAASRSAEERTKGREPWMEWAERCGSSLVDMGTPLAGGQRLSKSGSSPSDKQVVGYSVLEAENMEAAKALLLGHPHLEWTDGCEIEVHESMAPPR